MSDFVAKWVSCNVCFKDLQPGTGMLTSCGHFICSRPECRLTCASHERTTCPVCHASCAAISLAKTLPNEVIEFFQSPEILFRRSIDVMRFQSHQKELIRHHFVQMQARIQELEAAIRQLQEEKRELQESMHRTTDAKETKEVVQSELVIPGIIAPGEELVSERDMSIVSEPVSLPAPPISQLFTPTLASRLQTLVGKKIYDPITRI